VLSGSIGDSPVDVDAAVDVDPLLVASGSSPLVGDGSSVDVSGRDEPLEEPSAGGDCPASPLQPDMRV